MAYYMNYAHQSIEAPSITSLPKYVKCLMHTGVNDITLDIGDMDKTVFKAMVDEIRIYFCSDKSNYVHIGSWENPYLFHIPTEKDSAISFTEHEDRVEIHKVNIAREMELTNRVFNGSM